MNSSLRNIDDHGNHYTALMFVCPGCEQLGMSGLHMLAVNSPQHPPSWDFNGNLDMPTLSPSILTRYRIGEVDHVCHSFLQNGMFQFLGDCTHPLAGQHVPMPPLPTWTVEA